MTVEQEDEPFERVLEFVKRSRGFDFTGYKRATLNRRIQKRVTELKLANFDEYLNYLEVNSEEFPILFDTILINVTSFFRDPAAWEYLAREAIPALLSRRSPEEPIRAWSAACATGEEVYTLAMLLAEAVGIERFKDRVKIYATDVDEEALSAARSGTYAAKDLHPVPEDLQEKYFERFGDRVTFSPDLRRCLIFGRHDLVQDAPISRIDLLTCRNVLMYFNSEAQAAMLGRLHFALNDDGYLFLGRAEMLLTQSSLFVPVNLKARVFVKVARRSLREQLLLMNPGRLEDPDDVPVAGQLRLRDAGFRASPLPTLIVDAEGFLIAANDLALSTFNLVERDVGRPLRDLEVSYRPVDLRSQIDAAVNERSVRTIRNVEWHRGPDLLHLEVSVAPLFDPDGTRLGATIAFSDVTGFRQLTIEFERQKQELETAYEELQSSNEELETTNEELQSTVEELETTNEELQASNEELETLNEELQSTNEELQSMNDELRVRTNELGDSNSFLNTILGSMGMGVAVIDATGTIDVWNEIAEDMWGVRRSEVRGRRLEEVDIGLPVKQVAKLLKTVEQKGSQPPLLLDGVDRRGRPAHIKVSCLSLLPDRGSPRTAGRNPGFVVLMEKIG